MTTTKANVRFAPTLDAAAYSDPAHYKTETEKIFHQHWIYALHESQLPERGSYVTLEIGEKPLILIRGTDNIIRAFYNVCVHRGHLLAKGSGCATQLTCPYHTWTYGCDGRLRRARGIDDITSLPEAHTQLVPVEIENAHGFLFVRMQPGGPSLTEMFSGAFDALKERLPMLDRLKFAKRFVADVDGNWKIMIENYLECYHCAPTHRALVDLMQVKQFKVDIFPYYLETWAPAGRQNNTAYHFNLDETSQTGFSGWWFWPNVTFNIFPGIQNLLIFHMLPLAPEKTVGICDYFFLDGQLNEHAEALIEWESNTLEREDNDLVISTHKGLKSKVLPHGIYVVDESCGEMTEGPLEHFNYLVSQAVDSPNSYISPNSITL
jgi:phenylpropionate dioxygenase-like ring-hydroxylating dioxygenase large terminal subunit